MMDNISSNLGYFFKDKRLIELALTHKSFSLENNERLEFLGDAILNLYVSEKLYASYEDVNEGKLTRFKASIVSRDNLNLVALNLEIGEGIKLGKGEKLDGPSILGHTLEALIGAVFLDSNSGVAVASNVAFQHTKGDYIALLGDDDYWCDTAKIKKQLNYLFV